MFGSVRRSIGFVAISAALAAVFGGTVAARGATVLSEDFSSDPVAGGRATVAAGDGSRFTYSSGSHTLTAAYNTLQPTAFLRWSLGRTFNQNTNFTTRVDFNIHSAGFSADPNGFAQIAFGLINSATTGTDRTGSNSDFTSDNCYDMVTVDYFPNISPFFGGPSLQPTITQSPTGAPGSDAFSGILSPFGQETALDDAGESDLPKDVSLTATITYDAAAHLAVLRLLGPSGALPINLVGGGNVAGGPDGDITTMDLTVPPGTAFSVDSFALTLWNDGFGVFGAPDTASVTGNVEFSHISVTDAPEPATIGLMAIGAAIIALRRRR